MRLVLFAVIGLLASTLPAHPQQAGGAVVPGSEKSTGSSSKRLLFEVLETDAGVHGTNQIVYLRIFADGSTEYHPKRSEEIKRDRVSHGNISEDQSVATMKILVSDEVTRLPSVFKSTFTPIDFYWTLDFAIPRGNQIQRVKVVNFSPAMAMRNNKAYPEALVRLVCAAWVVRKQLSAETPDLSQECRDFAGQN